MDSCSYCGSIYEIQRDHVIPNSFLRERRKFRGDWIIPACGECNNTLGDELIFNVPDRASYLLARYEKKYKKVINFPEWSDEELEDISNRMKLSILASLEYKAEIRTRLEHLKIVSTMDYAYLYIE